MKLFICLASLIMGLSACHHRVPAEDKVSCSLVNFRVVNKSSDPNAARVREESVEIDGQPIKIGESSKIAYTFDSQNRPIASVYSTPGYSDYQGSTVLEYSANQLTVKTTHTSGAVSEVVFPLNAQGLLADVKYNADGFAIEEASDAYRTTYTIENGNITRKETRAIADHSLFGTVTYEYDLSRANFPNVAPYKGRSSRNLVTKETYVTYAINKEQGVTTVYEYAYTFDTSGRPSRRINKLTDGLVHYEVVDYEYACR